MYYLNSRFYYPSLRRFITMEDVNYLDKLNVSNLNLYNYSKNDSIRYYDPSGHAWYNVLRNVLNTIAGIMNLISTLIAIPSLINNKFGSNKNYDYYSMPWERTADWLGGVNRNNYKKGSLGWGIIENLLGPIVVPFYILFGF